MNSLVNVNHAICIGGYCISDSKYEQALCLTRESFDLLYSPSVGEQQVIKFEKSFFAVRYM